MNQLEKNLQPKVSIILPIYNVEKYLKECLDSILLQHFSDFEVLGIDDGSTDQSINIFKKYMGRDSRFKLYSQENLGAGAARNKGIRYAKSKYIFFCDADDIMHDDLLEKCYALAEKEKADIVAFNTNRFESDGKITLRNDVHTQFLKPGTTVFNYKDCPDDIMWIINPTPWNKFYRRDFIVKQKLFFEEISSSNDITFASVSYCKANRIVILNDVLYDYRWGYGGTITSLKSNKLMNIDKALKSAVRQVEKLPYFGLIKNSVYKFVIENYIYGFRNNLVNFNFSGSREYYISMYNTFTRADYLALSSETLGKEKNWRWLKTVQMCPPEKMEALVNKKIIVSLTSYPARIVTVPIVIESLLNQTMQADKICLFLSAEEFPRLEEDLPDRLRRMKQDGKIEIFFEPDNLRSHKKYYYVFQEYPDDLVITVDDDLIYSADTIEWLCLSYYQYPKAVHACRTHYMVTERNGAISKYETWLNCSNECINKPSMQLFATGVGGCLYQPTLFANYSHILFNTHLIKKLCFGQDDVWLKMIELLSKIPVVLVHQHQNLNYVEGTQDTGLWNTCNKNNEVLKKTANDIAIEKIIKWTDSNISEGEILNNLFLSQYKDTEVTEETKYLYWKNQVNQGLNAPWKQDEFNQLRFDFITLQNSVSFRLGRVFTWLPRKIRGGIWCLRDHGMGYTVKRLIEHLGIDMGTGA